jgi:SOS-response transcriptional repressor LexA
VAVLIRQDLHPQAVQVLLAILSHPGPYAPTLRELGAAAGVRSTATTHDHLLALRRRGLVDWEDGKKGTLRALVALPG